ncbi:condensation domain-containing protein [Dactylosporangium darangshiense]|uniref:condensation domain-containing protein n=1 Tax=Dactylosporangium darangshiense TaxID=579108 RepID=UPI00362F743C
MTDVSTLTAALPAQRRAALAVLLARRSASAFPVNEQPFNGCSFEQERLWLLRQLDAGDAVMPNATFGLRLWGTLDAGAMGAAFAAVVAHHEALRTVIDAGPSQRVLPTTGLAPLRVLDAAGNPERAAALTAEAAAERFDLATGPLCALTLIRLDEDDHALLFAGDHVALDEQSVAIVRRDLAAAYAAALAGRAWDPPAPAVRYRDYAAWSTARMSGEALHRRLEYWERILAEPRPLVGPSMTHGTAGTASVRTTLPAGGLDRLRAAGGPGTTPFVALLTALDVVLARLAGEPDVTVGTVYSARERAELEPLVGCFLNPSRCAPTSPARTPSPRPPAACGAPSPARSPTAHRSSTSWPGCGTGRQLCARSSASRSPCTATPRTSAPGRGSTPRCGTTRSARTPSTSRWRRSRPPTAAPR